MIEPEVLFAQTFHFDEAGASPVRIEIAGIVVELGFTEPGLAEQVRQEYQSFLSRKPPVAWVQVCLEESLQLDDGLEKGRVPPACWEDDSRITVAWRGFILVADRKWEQVRVVQRAGTIYTENVLRILYSSLVTERAGFLLHAAAVEREGEGIVFFGKSGSGKTTVARLSKSYPLLSDDMVIITQEDGRFWVWGTPFGGEEKINRQNRAVPLKQLFLLKQSSEVEIKRMSQRELATALMSNIINYTSDARQQARVLDRCLALALAANGGELHFRPDPTFWEVIANAA